MNRSEHNPLQRELARGRSGEPHPDADLLTAFAEGALLKRERRQVIEHLTLCAECRETLSTAADAAPDSTAKSKLFLLPRRALPLQRAWIPWASIAAALLVVCSAGLFYQQRQASQKTAVVAKNESLQLPSPMAQLLPLPPPSREKIPTGETAGISAAKPPQALLKSEETIAANTQREEQSQLALKAAPAPLNSAGIAILEEKSEAAKQSNPRQQNPYSISGAEAGGTVSQDSFAKPATVPQASAFANTITERALLSASATAAARPHWRINSASQAERSFGDGAWQSVLPEEQSRMRVISVLSGEVWIGGENARLYRSSDNGATWKLIALPSKDGRVHSIAHIHFQTSQLGTVEAEDGTLWTTSDGGCTWK